MKKIWRWICETAWIQPLLIVGLIFAVVFSIPSISSWINDLSKSQSNYEFYNKKAMSATTLLDAYNDEDGHYANIDDEEGNFLLVFVKKGCDNCEKSENAFKVFMEKDGWIDGKSNKVEPKVYFLYVNYDKDSSSKKEKAKAKEFEEFENATNLWDESTRAFEDSMSKGYSGITYSEGVDNYFANNEYPTPMLAYFSEGTMVDAIMGIPEDKTLPEKVEFIRDLYYHQGQFE